MGELQFLNRARPAEISERLLVWWRRNKRNFPWREERDPYRIMVAEILLQRTRAEQVKKIYRSFLARFPTPESLAGAREEEIEDFFSRLGLMWRAKKMKALGEAIVSRFGGLVPESREELLTLPGVGEYVASAVQVFAFGRDMAVVDANVCRVLGRIFGVRPKGEARRDRRFAEIARSLLPPGGAREFNWAVIDFASSVCVPGKPKCHECPISFFCKYFGNEKEPG